MHGVPAIVAVSPSHGDIVRHIHYSVLHKSADNVRSPGQIKSGGDRRRLSGLT